MNRQTLKKSVAAVAMALAASTSFAAEATGSVTPAASAKAEPKAAEAAKRQLFEESHQKIEQEAMEAITGTQNALIALQKKEPEKAMKLLQEVSGKLDILLAKYPGLALIPANVEADVYDFDSGTKQVEKLIKEADRLLKDHKIQDARQLLDELVSEMRITTTNIPLGSFPAAIKEAAGLIDKAKTDEAEDALYDVLNMLVKTTEILPLPVLRAEALLTAASEQEHKTDLSKEASRAEILKLTDEAKDKLKLAELLGYGDKADYKPLYDTIDELKDVIHSEKSAATWDKIKNSLSAFKDKIMHPKKQTKDIAK